MALADTITNLGNSIIALVGTRAKKDLSNIDEAGVEKIKSYAGGGGSNPVGTVIAYMGRTVPDGYLLMDGREVSKETYADLYAVVGDTMGTATDPTKFVIANMTDGRYLMGSTVAGASQPQCAPAITGYTPYNAFSCEWWFKDDFSSFFGGALYVINRQKGGATPASAETKFCLGFDAQRSNNTYQGSLLRPLSNTCVFLIKYMKY